MKQIFLIILVSIGAISCVNKKETPTESVELNKTPRGLSKNQLKDIEHIQNVFHEVEHSSLEKTIDKFRREEDPASEIKIWLQMADAYEQFTKNPELVLDQDKKQQAFELILLRSIMPEKEVREKIKSSSLSEKEINLLFSYYSFEPQPLEEELK